MITELYNVTHEMPFGLLIVVEMFLMSLSAGVFFSLAFYSDKLKKLQKPAALYALILLAFGMLAIILDLESPLKFFYVLIYFRPSSVMSWGSLILLIYGLCLVLYNYSIYKKNEKLTTLFSKLGLPFAALTALYPGFLLAVVVARPLWNNGIVPLLFLTLSLLGGTALILLISAIKGIDECSDLLINIVKGSIMAALFLIITQIIITLNSGAAASEAMLVLLQGSLSIIFICIGIILGLIVPLIVLFIPKLRQSALKLSLILILVGAFAIRYAIIIGGQILPLS